MVGRMKWERVQWESLPTKLREVQPRISRFNGGRLFNISHLVFSKVNSYLVSLESPWALGLFNCAAVALFSHKTMKIDLHGPLPFGGILLTLPSLFVFDVLTLTILHWGLNSALLILRLLAVGGSITLILLSSVFASLYLEGNTELNWSRSVEVFPFIMLADCRSWQIGSSFANLWRRGIMASERSSCCIV